MSDEYRKIECPWCHAVVFAPLLDSDRRELNNLSVEYTESICPECQKRISIIKDCHIDILKDIELRLDTENDKVAPLFAEIGRKYTENINTIRKDLDERIGKLREEWDAPPQEKIKVVVVAPDGTELESNDEVIEYIRSNPDLEDLEDWVNSNFDDVDIGPFSWSPSEIIEGMGESISELAEYDGYSCNYAQDRYDESDMDNFQDLDDPDNVNTPEDGSTVEIAGITFRYKWVKEDDNKV